jgi:hypothetical protein
MKIPTFKFQVPGKSKATNSTRARLQPAPLVFEAWNLGLSWNLELGTWNFINP